MIEILPERRSEVLTPLYEKHGLCTGDTRMASIAKFGDEVLGYCLFELTSERLTVFALEPQDDLMLADGILRAGLHVGVANEVMNAFYTDTVNEQLLKRLGFIGDEPKSLRVEKLFQSCKGCAN